MDRFAANLDTRGVRWIGKAPFTRITLHCASKPRTLHADIRRMHRSIVLLCFAGFFGTGAAQPVIMIPGSLPDPGLYHYNLHAVTKPYFLRDRTGTSLEWDLTKLKLADAVLQTDSLIRWADATDDSLPDGTSMVLHRAFGYSRSYLMLRDDELFELGTYAPYSNERTHYSRPFLLWSDGSGYGSYAERYSPILEDVMTRREVVGSGTLTTTFGRFPDLLLLKVWTDRDSAAEHYELVDPENVLRPLGLFWYNGDVQLFEPLGFESWKN